MAAPRKYPDELCDRAVRMAVDARKDPTTRPGALARIGGQLGVNPRRCGTGLPKPRSTLATARARRRRTQIGSATSSGR